MHLKDICLAFVKYKNVDSFRDMCIGMEMKFSQYWRNAPLTFCLASMLDPKLSIAGIETFHECH